MGSSAPVVTSGGRHRLATASMSVAGLAALTAFLPLAFVLTVPLAVAALVTGWLARRRAGDPPGAAGRDLATVSLVLAAFALLVGTLSGLATWNATRLPADYDPVHPATQEEGR